MRSTDARWHLAVEALARMPELAHRLVEVHQADARGYCRGCMAPGGTLFVRWPCGLHRLATAASAGDAPAAPPGGRPPAGARTRTLHRRRPPFRVRPRSTDRIRAPPPVAAQPAAGGAARGG